MTRKRRAPRVPQTRVPAAPTEPVPEATTVPPPERLRARRAMTSVRKHWLALITLIPAVAVLLGLVVDMATIVRWFFPDAEQAEQLQATSRELNFSPFAESLPERTTQANSPDSPMQELATKLRDLVTAEDEARALAKKREAMFATPPPIISRSNCYFVLFDAYSSRLEEFAAKGQIDEANVYWDGSDTMRPKIYVFKDYNPGAYRVAVNFVSEGMPTLYMRQYSGDLTFSDSTYYRVSWPKIPQTTPPSVGILTAMPVTPEQFARGWGDWAKQLPVPLCEAVRRGITSIG